MEEFECPNCGVTIKTTEKYCPSCGVRFKDNNDSKKGENNVKPNAEILVGGARMFAISSLKLLLKKDITFDNFFSSLNIQAKMWNYFATIALVFSGYIQFKESGISVNDQLFEELLKDELNSRYKLGSIVFDDLVTFRNKTKDLGDSINIGTWLMWNLKGFEPTDAELEIANRLGNYFLHLMNNWWLSSWVIQKHMN